ncbi:MAG: hypothetical protein AB8C02_14880, partial [Halioglobus sp.]
MRIKQVFMPLLALLIVLLPMQTAIAYELGDWDIHGTFSQGWIHSEDNNFIKDSKNGTFDFREFGVNASTHIGEHFSLGGQLVGRKYGVIGDDEIYVDWLSATYSFSDMFGVRAGVLKIPYGFYGDTRDIDSLRTQILLPQGVYAESYRGSINSMIGIAAFGTVYSDTWGSLDYSVQIGQSNINKSSGELSRLASDVEVVIDDVDEGDAGAIKLLWNTPIVGLRLGTTLTKSEFTLIGPSESLVGIAGTFESALDDQYSLTNSIEYSWDRIKISVESLYNNNESDFALDLAAFTPIRTKTELTAYYVHVDYFATQSLTLGLGYSDFSVDMETLSSVAAPTSKTEQDGYYFSVRYDVT